MYTKRKLGVELRMHLRHSNYLTEVANWAHSLYCEDLEKCTEDTLAIINELGFLGEEDLGFEYTKDELEFLAHKMIMEEDDPLQQLRNAGPITPITYSREWVGQELHKQLREFDVAKIASLANCMLICYKENLSKELVDILEVLSWMSERPEFEFTQKQINFLADKLLINENNALEQMADMK